MKPLARRTVSLHRAMTQALCGLALAASAGLAGAHSYQAGSVQIGHPWARPTVKGQTAGGGFMKLQSQGGADRLIGASTPAASSVELHSMTMDGEVMRMRPVDGIDVPAGQTVELKPGGLHMMFIGLKQPLAVGSKIPVKLRFEKAGEVTVDVKVENTSSAGHEGDAKHDHKH